MTGRKATSSCPVAIEYARAVEITTLKWLRMLGKMHHVLSAEE
jgi:hypothetical protein